MRRREFLSTAALIAARRGLRAAPVSPPNVLLVTAGGWRGQALPGTDPNLKTPNLERLMRESASFGRCYVSSPAPSPSRATLITGRFPHACGVPRNQMRLPLDQPSMAQQFRNAGYQTGYIGAWNLDGADEPGFVPPGPRRHGFEYWAAFNRGHRYFDSIYFRDTSDEIHRSGFEPDDQTDLAIAFVKQRRQKPFFLVLSWGPPAPPRTPPPRSLKLYDVSQVALRANVPDTHHGPARPELLRYYALCSALDDNLGRLLGALDEAGLGKDTVVVFTGDRGDMLYSQGLEGAGSFFEESVRVPLVIRNPRAAPNPRAGDLLFSGVDLMPTLLALCGVPVPENVQGQDLSPWLRGAEGPRPEAVYTAGQIGSADEWRMLVRGLDKIVVDRELNPTHLFNLGADPWELENHVEETSQELKRDELMALLKDWMRRTGDRMNPSGLKKRN